MFHDERLSSDFSHFSIKIKLNQDGGRILIPFFGSMLNFFRPIDICFSLLECLFSESCDSISDTTSHSSSLICCFLERGKKKKETELIISFAIVINHRHIARRAQNLFVFIRFFSKGALTKG